MTPTTTERLVRSALAVLLKGEGTMESRMDAVVAQLSANLGPSDQKKVYKKLRPRLMRALRQKTATLESATAPAHPLLQKLEQHARAQGAEFVETRLNPKMLAGYTLQIGDDREDLTLLARLQTFKAQNLK